MCKGLICKKLGMTGVFTPDGSYQPVTVVQAGPCVVTQVKTEAVDGYNALQLGFGEKKAARVNKPLKGHMQKSGQQCFQFLREVPVDDPESFSLGQAIGADLFAVGERIDVTGISKGRGFSGVIRRHGFRRGKETHGSHDHRQPGSIGCSAWPGKVIRGKRMPGQYGRESKTVRNLKIVDIRPEQNLILIRGALPGHNANIVTLKKLKFTK